MLNRTSRLDWLTKIHWRALTMWVVAVAFGELAGAAVYRHAELSVAGLAVLVSAVAGALGGAALFDALSPLLPTVPRERTIGRGAPMARNTGVETSSAWNFNYREAEPDAAWSSDDGRSQVAWAEATLAARDAWERAARNSRTRVVLGKRVIVGDPPPRSGDDT
jgi:hypothetical protein